MIAWTGPGNIIMKMGSYLTKEIIKLASKRGYLNILKKMVNLKKKSVGKMEEGSLNNCSLSNSMLIVSNNLNKTFI